MNHEERKREMFLLMGALVNETITPAQYRQFQNLLQNDPEARRFYINYIDMEFNLHQWHENQALSNKVQTEFPFPSMGSDFPNPYPSPASPSDSDREQIRQIEQYAQRQLDEFLAEQHRDVSSDSFHRPQWDYVSFFAGVKTRVMTYTRWSIKIGRWGILTSAAALLVLVPVMSMLRNRVVVTVVESKHAQWDMAQSGPQLHPGWVSLEQGFARLAFRKGTEVILQAPTSFQLQSGNRMYLETGWLTAKVPPQASGFTVETLGSRVVDYGTEFGLLVDSQNTAELHVFNGSVGLVTPSRRDAPPSETLLTQGQAGFKDPQGRVRQEILADRPHLFVRRIPDANSFGIPGKQIDLADVTGGGSGFGTAPSLSMIRFPIHKGELALPQVSRSPLPLDQQPAIDKVFTLDQGVDHPLITSTGISFKQRRKTAFRVDLSQNGPVEPGWQDWQTGKLPDNTRVVRSFSAWYAESFTVVFDSVDVRNRPYVDETIPNYRLLSDTFKNQDPIVMRLQGLPAGSFTIKTFHHDHHLEEKDSYGSLTITLHDATGTRVIADHMPQTWGPRPLEIATAQFTFVADGTNEVVIVFTGNQDRAFNQAHINGFILNRSSEVDLDEERGAWFVPCHAIQTVDNRSQTSILIPKDSGISFDLNVLRNLSGNAGMTRFLARHSLLPMDAGQEGPIGGEIWILVDGEVRLQQQVREAEMDTPMAVDLEETNRFLTLMVTDSRSGYQPSWSLFTEPRLELGGQSCF